MKQILEEYNGSDAIEILVNNNVYYTNPILPQRLILKSMNLKDDRIKQPITTVYPTSTICHLHIEFPNGQKGVGTGTIVSNNHVLTSAHNLYSIHRGGFANKIVVSPGKSGRKYPFKRWRACELFIPDNYARTNNDRFDFALLNINSNLKRVTGAIGLIDDKRIMDDYTITVAGYPMDKRSGKFIYYDFGNVTDIEYGFLYYGIYTSGGQSGSGIFTDFKNKKYLVGIHKGNRDNNTNRGVHLRREIFEFIHSIINK